MGAYERTAPAAAVCLDDPNLTPPLETPRDPMEICDEDAIALDEGFVIANENTYRSRIAIARACRSSMFDQTNFTKAHRTATATVSGSMTLSTLVQRKARFLTIMASRL